MREVGRWHEREFARVSTVIGAAPEDSGALRSSNCVSTHTSGLALVAARSSRHSIYGPTTAAGLGIIEEGSSWTFPKNEFPRGSRKERDDTIGGPTDA